MKNMQVKFGINYTNKLFLVTRAEKLREPIAKLCRHITYQ